MPRRPRRRPWTPLTDAEWATLAPYITTPGPGRPLRDPRGRLDAIFRICLTNTPWTLISTDHGPTSTIHRCVRRWAHDGLWSRLLTHSTRRRAPAPLRALRPWIAAVFRRCIRILGLEGIVLARRLRVDRALPGPAWYFPDPDLSETVRAAESRALARPDDPGLPGVLALCRRILARIAVRRRIPRCLVPVG